MKESNLTYFYALSGSQKELYEYLNKNLEIFLPKSTSKCLTDEYLENVLKMKVFILKTNQVKSPPFSKTCTKQELTIEINKFLENFNKGKKELEKMFLGFDETNPADKEWLKIAIYKLNPQHEFFVPDKALIDKDLLDKLSKKL